jgi:hypothetical protein
LIIYGHLIHLIVVAPSALDVILKSLTSIVFMVKENDRSKRICICLEHVPEKSHRTTKSTESAVSETPLSLREIV